MAQRLRLRCTENAALAGVPGRRLTFTPTLSSDENPNDEAFEENPGGAVQLVNVTSDFAKAYEVGKDYDVDFLVTPSGP